MEVDEGEGEVEGEGGTKASRASRSQHEAELDAVSASPRRVSTADCAAAPGVPPPAEFVCPITRSLMREPVSTIDGQARGLGLRAPAHPPIARPATLPRGRCSSVPPSSAGFAGTTQTR